MSSETTASISALYRNILGRSPVDSETAFWQAAADFGLTDAQIRAEFANSPEASGDVAAIYQQVLGRNPEPGGAAGWANALASGTSLAQVRAAIAASPEAQADIAAIYQADLARSPDQLGQAFWTASVAAGSSLAAIMAGIAGSAEAAQDVGALYISELGRAGDAAGVRSWLQAEASGVTLNQVRGAIAVSNEAQANLKAIVAAGAPVTLAQLTAQLAGGVSLASLRAAYATNGAGPTVTAQLTHDTGLSAADGITQDDTIGGSVSAGVTSLAATLDSGTAATSLTSALAADGSFILAPGVLDALAGGTLAAGAHVLHLTATAAAGQSGSTAVSFTLDPPPPVAFGLSALDQTTAGHTQSTAISLTGTTAAGVTLTFQPARPDQPKGCHDQPAGRGVPRGQLQRRHADQCRPDRGDQRGCQQPGPVDHLHHARQHRHAAGALRPRPRVSARTSSMMARSVRASRTWDAVRLPRVQCAA